jgi:hypothetical protein
MRVLAAAFLCLGGLFLMGQQAAAAVGISVDLSSQTMRVTGDSGEQYVWPVSTARSGFATPRGTYRPTSLQRMHYSRKYHMSPMPHSIFFRGGYAIHGTYETRALGRPASHGCIRLAPQNAARLFEMVRAQGATISITGSAPRATLVAKSHHGHHAKAYAKHSTHHGKAYAKRSTHSNPLAFAPAPRAPSVKIWMQSPGWH